MAATGEITNPTSLETIDSVITRELVIDAALQPRTTPEELADRLPLPAAGFGSSSYDSLVYSAEFLATQPRTTFWIFNSHRTRRPYKDWIEDRSESITEQFGATTVRNLIVMNSRLLQPMTEPSFNNAPYGQIFSSVIDERQRRGYVVDNMESFARRIKLIPDFGPKFRVLFLCLAELQRQDALASLSEDEIAAIRAEA